MLTLSYFSLPNIDLFQFWKPAPPVVIHVKKKLWNKTWTLVNFNFSLKLKYIATAVQLELKKKTLTGKWILQMINENFRWQWHDKRIPSNLIVLFDRPLPSFRNVIYIDSPNNYKTRFEFVWTIFCFSKITSFHTPNNNYKTLPLPSKLQREKWQEKLSQILDPLLFSDVFSCFFSIAFLEWKTDAGAHQRFLASNWARSQ